MMNDELSMRDAVHADISVLANHRRWMFEEMATLRGKPYGPHDLDEMTAEYTRYLTERLGGDIRAWVIEAGDRLIASGAVFVYDLLPRPGDWTGRTALLHSMYTDPDYRRRGLAKQIVLKAIEFCKAEGFRGLRLHASDAGRPVYQSLGFAPTTEMSLSFD
jgi:GNAT superfamily N-acetyltransferase